MRGTANVIGPSRPTAVDCGSFTTALACASGGGNPFHAGGGSAPAAPDAVPAAPGAAPAAAPAPAAPDIGIASAVAADALAVLLSGIGNATEVPGTSFTSLSLAYSRARCCLVCTLWCQRLDLELGPLGYRPWGSAVPKVRLILLRRPWDGPRFVWDDKLQTGEVLLADGSAPFRRSARGTGLDEPRLPIGTTAHPSPGLCVNRSFNGVTESVPCECITETATRALEMPTVSPRSPDEVYEEVVMTLGWKGWDTAGKRRRAVITTTIFTPVASLPDEDLSRLLEHAPQVAALMLQLGCNQVPTDGQGSVSHGSGSVQPAAGLYFEHGVGQMWSSEACRSLPRRSTYYRGSPLFPYMRELGERLGPSAGLLMGSSAKVVGLIAAQAWRVAPHLMQRLWRLGVPGRCGPGLLYPHPEEQDHALDHMRVQPSHQLAVRLAEGWRPGASAAALHTDKVDLDAPQPIGYLRLQRAGGTWVLGGGARELPGTALVTFETARGGAGGRVCFMPGYLTTVWQSSRECLHGSELPDSDTHRAATVPDEVLLRLVTYLLGNTSVWAHAMEQLPEKQAYAQWMRMADGDGLKERCRFTASGT